jgi:putative SOS response-associated peptidase YedK
MAHLPNKTRKERLAAGLDAYVPLRREPHGPVPTIGALLTQAGPNWVWAYCGVGCNHHSALALAPLAIRWGLNTSSDRLRAALRCSRCGQKGGTIRLPSWVDMQIGEQPFPAHNMAPSWNETMCNLYSLTSNQAAIRALARTMRDITGNQPSLPAIFPDQVAPVVRTAQDGARELVSMRWGFQPPPGAGARPVTNVRNTASNWWKPYLKPGARCLIPVTSFSEYDHRITPPTVTWFAQGDDRPLMFFAGIWRIWNGPRGTKANPVNGDHLLFSFLTTAPNAVVAPVHPKAMPVLLLDEAARETWLTGTIEEALALQRPAPDGSIRIVATCRKEDA